GAGNDFGGAGAASVDKHQQGKLGPALLRSVCVIAVGLGKPSTHADNLLPLIQEQVRNFHALRQQATWICPQVEDERFHSAREQPRDCTRQLVRRRITESLEIDVTDAVGEQRRPTYGTLVNCRPLHLEIERRRDSGTFDLQRNERAWFPAQQLRCFLVGPAFGGLSGDLDDAVTGLQAGPLSRAAGEWRHDDEITIAQIDLDSESGVIAARALVEPGEAVRWQERRVRIA